MDADPPKPVIEVRVLDYSTPLEGELYLNRNNRIERRQFGPLTPESRRWILEVTIDGQRV